MEVSVEDMFGQISGYGAEYLESLSTMISGTLESLDNMVAEGTAANDGNDKNEDQDKRPKNEGDRPVATLVRPANSKKDTLYDVDAPEDVEDVFAQLREYGYDYMKSMEEMITGALETLDNMVLDEEDLKAEEEEADGKNGENNTGLERQESAGDKRIRAALDKLA